MAVLALISIPLILLMRGRRERVEMSKIEVGG
jgi:hypothetical protein